MVVLNEEININRYNTLNDYFINKYGEKILKLSINGGFSCPNRINGMKGCLFCSEKGSGEFGGDINLSIENQIYEQKEFLKYKNKSNKYIAYFQSFTNTFDSINNLRRKYYGALNCEEIIGIAIATRPDCISEDIIELLKEINEKYELWVELGFQTSNEYTGNIIRRGYNNNDFEKAVELLDKADIKAVAHIIFGLPKEDKNDWLNTIKYIADKKLWGIKFHSLYIQKNSDLYEYYDEYKFNIIEKEEYIDIVCKAISLIPKQWVIHRITGDGDKKELFLPKWSADKLSIISSIQKSLKDKNIYQGDNHSIIYYKE